MRVKDAGLEKMYRFIQRTHTMTSTCCTRVPQQIPLQFTSYTCTAPTSTLWLIPAWDNTCDQQCRFCDCHHLVGDIFDFSSVCGRYGHAV